MKKKALPKLDLISKLNFLVNFGVAQKIWSGFAVALLMLVVVVTTSLFVLTNSAKTVDKVVNSYQPRTLASKTLSTQLQVSASALGFYLLSKDEKHEKNYQQGLVKVQSVLGELKKLVVEENDPKLTTQFQHIESLVDKFISFEGRLLHLAKNDLENLPAVKHASENVNPLNRQILQALSNMVMSEKEQEVNEDRRQLLLDLEELRYNWSTLTGHVRTYMIQGQKSALENVYLFYDQFQKVLKRVGEKSDLFTFEQEEFYQQVVDIAKVYNE